MLVTVTTLAPGGGQQPVEQQAGEGEVAEVVGAELHLEPVGRLPAGDGHDAGVVDQDVEPVVSGGETGRERPHRGQIGQVERGHLHVGAGHLGAEAFGGRPRP